MQKLEQLFKMTPEEYITWLTDTFWQPIPETFDNSEEWAQAGELLCILTNNYGYLLNVYGYMQLKVRQCKREKNKNMTEDFIDKRDLTDNMIKILKQQYATLSRMVTIRQCNLDELHMSDSR